MKKKVITSAILTIALALSILLGATYALFTSESTKNIEVTSGKVSIVAQVNQSSIQTKELGKAYQDGAGNTFAGAVVFQANEIVLERLVPGDGVKFTVDITNDSNVIVKYRVKISSVAPVGVDPKDSQLLFSALNFNVGGSDFNNVILYRSAWTNLAVGSNPDSIDFEIELPETAGNEYQDLATKIVLVVEAVQGNAEVTAGEEIIRLDGSANLTDNGISLDIPAGAIEDGQIPVITVSHEETPNFEVVGPEDVVIKVLKIELPQLRPNNNLPITVKIPVDRKMEDAVVYYNNGTILEAMHTVPLEENGQFFVSFTTTHFSEYILFDRPIEARVVSNTLEVYFNAEEALRSATSGDIVYLEKDTTLSEAFVIDKAITLDLGSFALNGDVTLAQDVKARMVVRSQTELNKAIDLGFKDIVIGQGLSTTLSVTGSGFTFSSLEEVVFNAAVRMLTINGSNNTIDGLMAKTTLPSSQRNAVRDYAIMINGSNNTVKNSVLSMGGTHTWGATIFVTGTTADSVTTFSNIRLNEITSARAFRGLLFNGYNGTVIVEDSLITSSGYTINIDGSSSTGKLIVNDSVLKGWTSYSKGYEVEFNNSTFEAGVYNVVASYTKTTFNNVTFKDSIEFYAQTTDVEFYFNDSTYNGQPITLENLNSVTKDDSTVVFVNGQTLGFARGAGTEDNPWIIETEEQFQNITSKYNDAKSYYWKLAPNLVFTGENWKSVKLNGSIDGNGVKFTKLDQTLFSTVKTVSKANSVIKNFDITADIINTGWTSAVVSAAYVGIDMINVNVHGQIIGVTGVASFMTFLYDYIDDVVFTIKDSISDAKVVALTGSAAGFIAHPMYHTRSKMTLKVIDSAFTGTLVGQQGFYWFTNFYAGTSDIEATYSQTFFDAYELENNHYYMNDVTNKPYVGTYMVPSNKGGQGMMDTIYNGPKQSLNSSALELPETKGDPISVVKVEGATRAVAFLRIAPNDVNNSGNYVSTYMTEEIDLTGVLAGSVFQTSQIKYFNIAINPEGVMSSGPVGDTYNVVHSFYGHTHNGADVYVIQYNGDEIVSIQSVRIAEKNS